MTTELKFENVWQQPKEAYSEAIADLWARNGVQFTPETARQRISEMAYLVFRGDRLVAVCSLGKSPYLYKGVFMGFFRTLVDQDERRSRLAETLTGKSANMLEAWSKENPDAGYMGFMIVLENKALGASEIARNPIWPVSGTVLVDVNKNGQQKRIKWFDHAELPSFELL